MPLVKRRYLFSPGKWRKDNKSMFFSEEHPDLKLQLPLLLLLPFSCICNSSWMHKWVQHAPKSHTTGRGELFNSKAAQGAQLKQDTGLR